MNDFNKRIGLVDKSYKRRKREETRVWKGFDEEVLLLKREVSKGLTATLERVHPTAKNWQNKTFDVTIKSFDVEYHPEAKKFDIEIKDWSVNIDGREKSDIDQGCCAYEGLKMILGYGDGEQAPLIKNFMREYSIQRIFHDCRCGSDHK